jgi:hypothetical protein
VNISIIKIDSPKTSDDSIVREGIVFFNAKILGEKADHFSVYLKDGDGVIRGGATVWVHTDRKSVV